MKLYFIDRLFNCNCLYKRDFQGHQQFRKDFMDTQEDTRNKLGLYLWNQSMNKVDNLVYIHFDKIHFQHREVHQDKFRDIRMLQESN